MQKIINSIILCVQFIIVIECQTLPKDIKKCKFGDSKCVVDSMNTVIRLFPKGIPEIGLKPIDVIPVPNLTLWAGNPMSSTYVNLAFFNQINYGFENTTITKVEGFEKNPTRRKMQIEGSIPSLIHKGSIRTNGRVLLISTNTVAESESDFQGFHFTIKLKVIPEYRNNKRYLKVYELVPTVRLKRWILSINGLFPDNSDLTMAVNSVVNKNWLEIWNELEPSFLNVFSKVFLSMIEDFFIKMPYDDMFLPEEN